MYNDLHGNRLYTNLPQRLHSARTLFLFSLRRWSPGARETIGEIFGPVRMPLNIFFHPISALSPATERVLGFLTARSSERRLPSPTVRRIMWG